jgi:hypothetical protein
MKRRTAIIGLATLPAAMAGHRAAAAAASPAGGGQPHPAGTPNAGTPAKTIVVVGGGFGGSTCARRIAARAPHLRVVLVDPASTVVTCPFSNLVVAGAAALADITRARAPGRVEHVAQRAVRIDAAAHALTLASGARLHFERLVLAPGVDLDCEALDGYSEAVAAELPHAWRAGPQTALLARQLAAMPDGGVFAIAVPDNPYRCPPGPYERAGLVAWYCQRHKPRAKVLVLDVKDDFTKRALFLEGWRQRYGGMVEWVAGSAGGRIVRVDAARRVLHGEFDTFHADVANVIPPQRAAAVARDAGLDAGRGWCEVDATTFESRVQAGVHVIGDAINAAPMPKSAFAAHNQGCACADAIVALLAGRRPEPAPLLNTCYSFVAPDHAISIAGAYRSAGGAFAAIEGAGGVSPLEADASFRAREAGFARAWYANIVADAFG